MPEELAASNLIQDIRIRSAECVTPEYEIPAHPAKLAMKDTSGTAAQPAMKRTRRRQHHPLLRYRPPGRRPLERLSDSATASGYSALSLCCCKSVMHCVSPAEALQRNKALQRRTYRSRSSTMLEKSFCGVQDVHIQAMSPQARSFVPHPNARKNKHAEAPRLLEVHRAGEDMTATQSLARI